ncbi:MAG: hypothetical protein K0R63_856 [Rickettsiales bacterium]|jgi:hypothetical protein|nr:hypothetical protein [Rickettsiales bacterium]
MLKSILKTLGDALLITAATMGLAVGSAMLFTAAAVMLTKALIGFTLGTLFIGGGLVVGASMIALFYAAYDIKQNWKNVRSPYEQVEHEPRFEQVVEQAVEKEVEKEAAQESKPLQQQAWQKVHPKQYTTHTARYAAESSGIGEDLTPLYRR